MNVVVVFFGQARLAAGCERAAVDVPPGCTPGEAVLYAADILRPELRDFLLDANGRPRQSLLLAVGQRQVSWDAAGELRAGDALSILPPIAGGCGDVSS